MTSRRLPTGWQQIPLEELVQPFPGHWGMDVQAEGLTPAQVLGVGNVLNDGNLDVESVPVRYLAQSELECIAQEGDLLVVKSSGSATNIRSGKTAICPHELTGRIACSNFMMLLRPAKDKVEPRWLWRYLNGRDAKAFVQLIAGSSTYPNIKWSSYKNLLVPVPPLHNQQRIVAKLDEQMSALDRAEKALAEQQAAACLLTAAVLQHVFSGPKSTSWLSARLVTVGTFDAGGTPAKDQQSYWADTGYPFVTGADITSTTVGARNARAHLTQAGLDSGKTAVCPAGTVLVVTRTRVGRIGVAGETVAVSQDITAFTCHHNLLPAYVMWYLRKESEHLIAQSRGATIQGLRRSVLENLNIPVPPVPEQKQLIETVEQATHNAALLQEDITHRLGTVASMRTSLLDAAFSGEISHD